MSENESNVEIEMPVAYRDEVGPCGHTRVDHVMQRVELITAMTEIEGGNIPEGEFSHYATLTVLAMVFPAHVLDLIPDASMGLLASIVTRLLPTDVEDPVRHLAEVTVDAVAARREVDGI